MRALAFILSWLFLYLIGCRKVDLPFQKSYAESALENTFFNKYASTNPHIVVLIGFVKNQNRRYKFVESLAGSAGIPIWNKAITVSSGIENRRTENSDSAVTFIPFVKDSQNFVNATLLIKIKGEDTSFKMLYDWQYREYEFESSSSDWTAADIFNIFATLDKQVFDRKEFLILDGRLFGGDSTDNLLAKVDSTYCTNRTNILSSSTFCHTFIQYAPCSSVRQIRSNVYPSLCYVPSPHTVCTTVWTWVPDGNGEFPSGGGGGGWHPPPPPCGSGRSPNPCGPGWEPWVGDEPPIEPIDSLLKRYSRAIKDTAIYVYDNLSQPANAEYAFTGIISNGQITVTQITTDGDSISVTPKLMIGNVLILFIWHSHVSNSSNPADRSTFSPDDINTLRHIRCLKQNFISFADCRNKRYALVISDVTKASAFFNSTSAEEIFLNWTTTNATGNTQDIDERKVKNVIGSAATNGISFYVSNDGPGFQSWTLLNP